MKKINNIIVTVTVIVCSVLALYMFGARFMELTNGFQYDELYSVATGTPSLSWSVIWNEMLMKDVNLPLFNILFYGWNHIFPISPFYGHLFSTLLSALAVVAAWLLAPKSWPRLKRFFLVAMMSCSYILVVYGLNIRSYSLSVLLSTCFTLLALRILDHLAKQEKPSRALWLWFFGTGLLGAYSHYFCTAIFFSAALMVFLYACYFRCGRAWSFWGTAVVFFLWLPWAMHAVSVMGGVAAGEGASEWWYNTPFMLSVWGMFAFLFGTPAVQFGLLLFCIVAGESVLFTERKKILLRTDYMLPLGQVILLLAVLSVVGLRFNLWMDRYFLPLLPPIFILLSGLLYELQERHRVFILYLPVLLLGWVSCYWQVHWIYMPEYTGLRDAFTYLTGPNGPKKVLVDRTRTGYPSKAVDIMLDYYVPAGSDLEMIELTPQSAHIAWESNPKVPILMLLCSQVHLIYTSLETATEEDAEPMLFGKDTCLYTAHHVELKKDQNAPRPEEPFAISNPPSTLSRAGRQAAPKAGQ